jgi:predicted pyridoxine 5'-phosphate oxidase superfamily flavin-nucleotide-binding protein
MISSRAGGILCIYLAKGNQMFNDEVREFLKKTLLARMSTIDPNGYPHTVPVWFSVDGDELVITAPATTKKLGHIRSNPKGCVTIGGDVNDGGGWMFKGHFRLSDEDKMPWLREQTYRYEPKEQADKDIQEWANWDIRIIRFTVEKVIKV